MITLFPKLANVNNVEFVKKKLLDSAMEYLMQNLKKSVCAIHRCVPFLLTCQSDLKDKATIFLSIADIATAVKTYDEFNPYVKPVMNELTQVFLSTKTGTGSGLSATIQSPVLSTTKVRCSGLVRIESLSH